jgi:tetratricopeptide (TPR) repeat protein
MVQADQKSLFIKLAHIYYHTGSWDKAIVEYEKIIALDPNDFNVRATLGELYLKKGDRERSFKEFDLAANGYLAEKNMKKASGAFRELAGLIQKTVEQREPLRAVQLYKDILAKMPESVEAMSYLRDLQLGQNQAREAVLYTVRLGDLYNKLDYVDKAQAEYQKACDLDPGNSEAKDKLAKLKSETGGGSTPPSGVA